MSYDPFARGPFPVGVMTQAWHDARRDRTLDVEIWYPASDAVRGGDLPQRNPGRLRGSRA